MIEPRRDHDLGALGRLDAREGFQDPGMNSFNHYGLGSVGDWLYDRSAASRRQTPGYKTQLVKPSTGAELSSASSAVKTSYGDAKTSWSRDAAGRLSIDVEVPVNTRAEVHVPLTDGQQALESGKPAAQQPGVTYKGTTNGDAVYEVGSGSYRFLAAIVDATSVNGDVTAQVPATLALTLNSPVSFGPLTPGVAKDYTANLAGSVTSTAGDAALTVHDPSATLPGTWSTAPSSCHRR